MIGRGKGKTVGSPMLTNIRREVRVVEEERKVVEGHKSPECKKPKKTIGKVFVLSGEGAGQVDNLIR
ncbi:hypothetical protein A2U01_0045216, partial [Trifolium medium]|nr:hypothetical protein [Trifolium medium]